MEKVVKIYLAIAVVLMIGVFLYASGVNEGEQQMYEEIVTVTDSLQRIPLKQFNSQYSIECDPSFVGPVQEWIQCD